MHSECISRRELIAGTVRVSVMWRRWKSYANVSCYATCYYAALSIRSVGTTYLETRQEGIALPTAENSINGMASARTT